MLNIIDRWLLKRLIKKAVKAREINRIFTEIQKEAQLQYYEDNIWTRQSYLKNLLQSSMCRNDKVIIEHIRRVSPDPELLKVIDT